MSFLKSSIVYLKDINIFLRNREEEYGSLDKYIDKIRTNEPEWNVLLKNVVMKYHRFNTNKKRYEMEIATAERNAKTIKGFVIAVLVICLVIFLMRFVHDFKKGGDGNSLLKNIRLVNVYVIMALVAIFIGTFVVKMQDETLKNIEGDRERLKTIDTRFSSLYNEGAIAWYYVTINNMHEPRSNPRRFEINRLFKLYQKKSYSSFQNDSVRWNELEGKIQEAMRARNNNQANTLKKEQNELTPNIPHTIGVALGKIREGNHTFEQLALELKWFDTVIAMKDIQENGSLLKELVQRKQNIIHSLDPSKDTEDVLTKEILPLFNLNKNMYSFQGWRPQDLDGIKDDLLTTKDVSDNIECMLSCSLDDSCMVASFNNPKKQCSLFKKKIQEGDSFAKKDDSFVYVKDKNDTTIFLQGKDKTTEKHKSLSWDLEGKSYDCKNDCLAGEECVKFIQEVDTGKCTKTMSESPFIPTTIDSRCEGNDCYLYKQRFSSIGTSVSVKKLFDSVKHLVRKQLVSVCEKHDFKINLLNMEKDIKDRLAVAHGPDFLIAVGNEISDLLEKVQQECQDAQKRKLEESKEQKNEMSLENKYISIDGFIEKFDKLNVAEFMSIGTNVEILAAGVSHLNGQISQQIADNRSATNNIFLAKERQLSSYKMFVGFGTAIAVLGYLQVVLKGFINQSNDGKNSIKSTDKGKSIYKVSKDIIDGVSVDSYFRMFVPLVFLVLSVIIVVSWIKKTEALNDYNRDVLEKNGTALVENTTEMKSQWDMIRKKYIENSKEQQNKFTPNTLMGDITIVKEDKVTLYNWLVGSVDLLDKCNLLFDGVDIDLQFPWMDITINLAIAAVCVIVACFVVYKLSPSTLLSDLKQLYIEMKRSKAGETVDLSRWCEDDTEDISVSLKFVGFIIFLMIMWMFGTKLLDSAENYKMGLYNSKYYKEDRCAS